ncbi:MAG: ArnT family glycosyltransferase [Chitinophagales bacterium]
MKLFFKYAVFIALTGVILFIPFLWSTHLFDWDEINFAECSREMLKMHDYTRIYVDFKPFWEKPPMFFWMQALSMKIFGINEFAARFPNAICGITTLVVIFLCGSKIYNKKFGLLWSLAYLGSIFPNMYFKSGIIDPWYNLFTFLSLFFFILYHWKRNGFDKEGLKKKPVVYAIYAGVFMGLAILTKGQVALMVFLLVLGVYIIYNRFKLFFSWPHAILFLVVTLLVTLSWYGYETIKNGPWFITQFFKYQYRLFTTHDAGQKGFFGYHYVVILIGCFPASIFAIPSFFKTPAHTRFDRDLKRWMIILFWVVTILFTIAQSRIIHYSSLAWFPVTFLAAYTFYKWEQKEMNFKKYTGILAAIIGGIIALAVLAVPIFALNIRKFIPYVKDKFAQANMQADVYWSGWESLIGLFLIIMIVIGIWRLKRKEFQKAALIFFSGTAIFIFLVSAIIVPKIERYSQGAAIDFLKQRKGEDCYVSTLGYKSYAQFFYTQKEKPVNPDYYTEGWLLTGKIDKPAYFVSRVNRAETYLQYPELKELYRKNGYVFLKREIPK